MVATMGNSSADALPSSWKEYTLLRLRVYEVSEFYLMLCGVMRDVVQTRAREQEGTSALTYAVDCAWVLPTAEKKRCRTTMKHKLKYNSKRWSGQPPY